jgi:hypothetical protein
MQMYGGVEVKFHSFLASALEVSVSFISHIEILVVKLEGETTRKT